MNFNDILFYLQALCGKCRVEGERRTCMLKVSYEQTVNTFLGAQS